MDAHVLPINIPLPDLSGDDALELAEFLYELAGRFEASYRHPIARCYRDMDELRSEQRGQALFGNADAPRQLELFDDPDPF